jgi:hypothetical protein
MPILTFPYAEISAPSRVAWRLVPRTQVFSSPLNGGEQTAELPGARWEAEITWAALTKPEVRRLRAFVIQLKGRAGRFYLHDFSHASPSGIGTGTPRVNGASQTGNSLITDGWTPSETGILKAGDYFALPTGELKMLTADANSNGSGQATLAFEPPIRTAPTDNHLLTLVRPPCVMRLTDDDQDQFAVSGSLVQDYTLKAVEAFL